MKTDGEEGLLHLIMIAARMDSELKVVMSRHFDNSSDPQARIRILFDGVECYLTWQQAEWESVHNSTVEDVLCIENDEEHLIAELDGKIIAFTKISDLVVYVVGSGIYDEIILSEFLDSVISSLKNLLPKGISSSGVFEEYAKISVAIDDMACSGILV
jgi:hypothetical protein